MSEILQQVFRHHLWANLALLDACDGLADGVLDASVDGTYGSVRDTLVHQFAAEGRYLAAMTSTADADPLREGDFPGFARLKEAARTGGEKLIEVAGQETGDRIIRGEHPVRGKYAIPVSTFFAQAINHATEHRAHVCTILTQQGVDPPGVDVWAYQQAAQGSRK